MWVDCDLYSWLNVCAEMVHFQLLSQIVMRVTVADGAFETLVATPIPGELKT